MTSILEKLFNLILEHLVLIDGSFDKLYDKLLQTLTIVSDVGN